MMDVTHIITGLNDGGAEAVLYRLCTHDGAHRHTVISLMDEGKYGPLLRAAGVEVLCLDMPRGHLRPRALWRLWHWLRTQRPDVVQTWMYHADLLGGVVARLAGIRAVVWGIHHTTLEPGESSRATRLIARLLARLSRRVPRRIVACAGRGVQVHGALGYDTARMRVVPNGYDLARFAPDPGSRARLRAALGGGRCHARDRHGGALRPAKRPRQSAGGTGPAPGTGSAFRLRAGGHRR
jgi:glycosyltransferase involved in cell wall biosynthesis